VQAGAKHLGCILQRVIGYLRCGVGMHELHENYLKHPGCIQTFPT
jgi:hypothetical protein